MLLAAEADPAEHEMQLSFAGCGFLCIYHAGVCAAIKEYAPQLAQNRIKGSSAGAIAAAGLICNVCMSHATSTILQTVTEARAGSLQALSPNFDILALVRRGLEDTLPQNAHLLCTGRLFISATRARDYANVLLSEFATREELIQAILCSCFIPFYCGRTPPSYRGEQYVDGGFSDNQPGKSEPGTVTVSPFSGESDICPSDEDSASLFGFDFCGTNILFTTQNLFRMVVILFPPSPEVCSRICRQGFDDALRFLTKNHLVPCVKCLTVQSNAISVSSSAPPTMRSASKLEEEGEEQQRHDQMIRDESRRRRAFTTPSSASNLRQECERCMQPLNRFEPHRFSAIPLPSVVQKTLADMEARNSASWLNWLRRWRLIRWWLRLVVPPVLLPFELLQFSAGKIRCWLKRTALAPTETYLLRFQSLVDFILAEVEQHRLVYSPSGGIVASASTVGAAATAILPVGPLLSLRFTEMAAGGESAMPAALSSLAHRKVSLGAAQRKVSTSMAPLDLAIASGRMAELAEEEPRTEARSKADNARTLQQFCERNDAVLAFHYRDDHTNELKMCQIFDAHGRHPRQQQHGQEMAEYAADEWEEWTTERGGGEDSGLSLEEEEGHPEERRDSHQQRMMASKKGGLAMMAEHQQKKDACCSPIRHLANQIQQQKGAGRRHTFSSRPVRLMSGGGGTRQLTTTTRKFVAPGSRLYASNSMNALRTSDGTLASGGGGGMARRKVSVQTIGGGGTISRRPIEGGTESEDEEEAEEKKPKGGSGRREATRVQRKWSGRK